MGVHRKQIAAAFKLARSRLWDGRAIDEMPHEQMYICHAIGSVTKEGIAAQKVVLARLGKRAGDEDHRTVVCWLEDFVPEYSEIECANRRRLLVQEYRLRWLDSLIKEFSA